MKLLFIFILALSCAAPDKKSKKEYELLSSGLRVQEIAAKTYVATDTDFYWSNILISKMEDGTVLIASSPFDSYGTNLLIKWIQKNLAPKKIIAINTHFHRDGIGGNEIYHKNNVETWANEKTIKLTKAEIKKPLTSMLNFVKKKDLQKRIKETKLEVANNSFSTKAGKTFKFPNEEVQVYFPGHAHSPDNVVVYLKNKKILFGGCMIKPKKKGLGYLGVANVKSWDLAMNKLNKFSPEIVVPGHGKWGGSDFLSKTQENVIKHLNSTSKK